MNNQNNSHVEYKNISNKLPVAAIGFVIIIVLGIVFMSEPEKKYVISSEQMLEEALKREDVIRPEKFTDIYYNNDSLFRFVDLRSPYEFSKGHIRGAINIPLNKILLNEYEPFLNQDKKINILYYSDECGACGPWLIFKQLGFKNNRILQGGYDYVKKYIIDQYAPMTGDYRNEKAKYDFAKVISNTAGVSSNTSSKSKSPKKITVKKVKVEEEEGGC